MSQSQSNKGERLELRAARYFQAHGYLVRRNVRLSVAAGTKEATDIDVLGIRFDLPLAEDRLVADCKDRKRPKPFERILWASGLASFANANNCVVVTPNAPWQAREFASQAGVGVLEATVVDSFLQSTSNTQAFGEATADAAKEVTRIAKNASKHQDLKELFRERLRLRQMLVVGHPITNLNRIIRSLSYIGNFALRGIGDVATLARLILFDAAAIASIMLVRYASESKWTPEKDWSSHLIKRLTYGDVSPHKASQLAKLAFKQDFYEGLPTPKYTNEISKVVGYLIEKPYLAVLVPYGVDFILMGRTFGPITEDYLSPYLGEMQDDAIRAVKRVLSALSYASEIPSSIWETKSVSKSAKMLKQEELPMNTKKG